MAGYAQLADDEHVKGHAEFGGDLGSHGDTTAGQCEHDQAVTVGERYEEPGEPLSGFPASLE